MGQSLGSVHYGLQVHLRWNLHRPEQVGGKVLSKGRCAPVRDIPVVTLESPNFFNRILVTSRFLSMEIRGLDLKLPDGTSTIVVDPTRPVFLSSLVLPFQYYRRTIVMWERKGTRWRVELWYFSLCCSPYVPLPHGLRLRINLSHGQGWTWPISPSPFFPSYLITNYKI